MRRVVVSLLGTISGLVVLLNFKSQGGTATGAPPALSATGANTTGSSGGTPSSSTPSASSSSASSSSSSSTTSGTKTITGDSVDTRWGPVQVQITVTSGKLSNVTAINYPWNNGRDQELNTYAIPQLNQEALSAGSAKIDMISGATYTSTGYINSLQSALDKAGL